MRVFGIDCGTECTGYGVVDLDEQGREARLVSIEYGGIRLPKREPLAHRLLLVHQELSKLIEQHRPDVVAVEEVFHSVNAQSALKLGHVRGVALLSAAGQGLPVVEYAPLKIKSSVVGYGLAKKEQVQYMVGRLLHLPAPPEPADAADALAIAICHLHHAQTARNQSEGSGEGVPAMPTERGPQPQGPVALHAMVDGPELASLQTQTRSGQAHFDAPEARMNRHPQPSADWASRKVRP